MSRARSKNPVPQHIIVLSSDSEGDPQPTRTAGALPRRSPAKKPTNKLARTKKKTYPTRDEDVLEISSDDDVRLPNPIREEASTSTKHLQAQIDGLIADNTSLKRKSSALEAENANLRESTKKAKFVSTADLEDSLSCEICTVKMWTPYILPGCGHAYCEGCLIDWFSTIQTQHMARNPHYHPNQQHHPMMYAQLLRQFPFTPEQRFEIENIISSAQKPQYTCPTCRAEVRTAPVESFNLKSAVRTVAAAEGEKSPRKEVPKARRGGRAPAQVNVWEGFFPSVRR